MKNLMKHSFEPSLRKTPERYEQHSELLPKVVRSLFPSIIKMKNLYLL